MSTISKIKVGGTIYDIVRPLEAYPVGSIYLSVNGTSPAQLFGGTWEQLKDRFLLATGDTYTAGSTGGDAQHILTIEEMPRHKHGWKGRYSGAISGTGTQYQMPVEGSLEWQPSMEPAGGNKPHNNMPPYLAVYMWKRIA